MNETRCPSEDTLLPFASGETVAEAVRDHVETCRHCRSRIDRLCSEFEELRSSPPMAVRQEQPPRPAIIGRYLVVGELDSGGQSVVYRAMHPTLDKELVVKLGREPVESGSGERDLLVREGKLLASLDHPNLARVYDLDFHGDLPFLVMEYVRGPNLADYASDGGVSPRHAAGIVAGVARALAVVHRRGVIHQDIKPRNIMIDEHDRPRLIDFGLARLRHAWDRPDEPFGGTPAYSAPEQARGEVSQVTARSDIFSLGGVLYFLLTGQAPFAAPTSNESLAKASRCDFDKTKLDAVRPRRLAAVCLRAMSPDIGRRYERADAFAQDLEQIATPIRSRRAWMIGGVGVAAAALGIWLGPHLFDPIPIQSDFRAEILRNGKFLELNDAAPLHPDSDTLRLVAHIPPKYFAAMYSYDVGASVERIDFKTTNESGVQTLYFPSADRTVTLTGHGTTQIVIVAASKDEEKLAALNDRIAADIQTEFADLRIPRQVALHFDRGGVRSQSFGETKPAPSAKVEERLREFVHRLHETVEIVHGVAFCY